MGFMFETSCTSYAENPDFASTQALVKNCPAGIVLIADRLITFQLASFADPPRQSNGQSNVIVAAGMVEDQNHLLFGSDKSPHLYLRRMSTG
ncbi:MAG: hypothetical protein WBG40_17820, partial [Candidatus Sulfotelmatobacter sp.]